MWSKDGKMTIIKLIVGQIFPIFIKNHTIMSNTSIQFLLLFFISTLLFQGCSKEISIDEKSEAEIFFENNVPQVTFLSNEVEEDDITTRGTNRCCHIASIEDEISFVVDPSTYNGIGVRWKGAYYYDDITANYKVYYLRKSVQPLKPILIADHTFEIQYSSCRIVGSGYGIVYNNPVPSGYYKFDVTLTKGSGTKAQVCSSTSITIER